LCFSFVLSAQTPTVTVSAANVQIDPSGIDSYAIQGSISGITANGAQSIVFSVAQFGMGIPLTAFVQQSGSPTFSADSSCSGLQPSTPCPNPQAVGIRVQLTEAHVNAPMPATFSVTLNIEFVNQCPPAPVRIVPLPDW
jgi:hypothetical protein